MAIPKPEPRDWQLANAQELLATDREVLAMLRAAKKRVDTILADLPAGKQEIKRAQLEQTRARLLAEQATIFERLGDIVSARRARSASRSSGLSAAANEALLRAVGMGAQGQFLYKSSLEVSQRAIDAAMARMKLSALPLSRRIYNTSVWMGGRLGKLINETLATGLDAREFAKRARDWFNPNTPGGVRYAAMRLARTEINNAFHAMTAEKAANDPWINEVEWNLSKSHPKPDICNEVNADSPYPADRVPARPHPQCMCYITPKPIDEDEFIDRFVAGEYDDFLDKELEAAGWKEEHPEPPPPVAINSGPPSQSGPEPLRGDEAMASVPKGLFKRGSMKPKQRDALKIYESGWFIVIQNRLREQRVGTDLDDSINKKDDATIGLIDEAMEGSALPSDVEVWRGMFNARTVFGDRLDGDLTGMTWHDRGYGSTTTEEKITDLFITGTYETGAPPVPDSVKMKVLVKAGTKALATSNKDKGSKANGGQAEITLQHDTDWRIVQDNGVDENGVRNLVVEVQPHVERTESGEPDEGQDRTGTDDRAPEGQPGGGPEASSGTDRPVKVLTPQEAIFAQKWQQVSDPERRTGGLWSESFFGMQAIRNGMRNKRAGKDLFAGTDLRRGRYDVFRDRVNEDDDNSAPLYTEDDFRVDVDNSSNLWESKLENSPVFRKILWRGMRMDSSKMFQVGEEFSCDIASWTEDRGWASVYANTDDASTGHIGDVAVLLKMTGVKHSVDIDDLLGSSQRGSKEHIARGTYRVRKVTGKGRKFTVEIEEI